jgi:hypothetical protein
MANSVQGNKIYIDATGTVADSRTKVAYILFTPGAANDQLILRETSGGSDIFYIRSATANETMRFDFALAPLVFNNGIYVQTLTSGAKAVLVTTNAKGAE